MQPAPEAAATPQATHTDDPLYLRASQAAKRCGISRTTLWRAVKSGRLPPPICFGPRIRLWKVDELDQAFEKSSAPARAA